MSTDDEYDDLHHILLVGDASVGKTSLLLRFVDDSYVDTSEATIGVEFKTKTMNLDGKTIKLQIWDTAGQERFQTLPRYCYLDIDGIMIVYDVTKMESFNNIAKRWLNEIAKLADYKVRKLLVGNKRDLVRNKVVDTQTAKAYADQIGIPFLETSAKDSINVEQAFLTMAREIMKETDTASSGSESDHPARNDLPVSNGLLVHSSMDTSHSALNKAMQFRAPRRRSRGRRRQPPPRAPSPPRQQFNNCSTC